MQFTAESSNCTLEMEWICWYDVNDFIIPYSYVELRVLSNMGCDLKVALLSPLAGTMALPSSTTTMKVLFQQ